MCVCVRFFVLLSKGGEKGQCSWIGPKKSQEDGRWIRFRTLNEDIRGAWCMGFCVLRSGHVRLV